MKPSFKTTTVEHALQIGPRRFVKEYLFPAMRRERGNGFVMDIWNWRIDRPDQVCGLDGLDDRRPPSCGSVMCIGGTMHAIISEGDSPTLAQVLGLDNVGDLFFGWCFGAGPWKGLSDAFHKAKTPAAKERIAEKAVLAAIRMGERERKEASHAAKEA